MSTAVSTQLDRIETARDDIAQAIRDKGVTVPTTAKINELAPLVSSIPATTPKLQNKTVIPSPLTQSVMADRGYDGLNVVTVNPIPSNYKDATGADAIPSQVAEGAKFVGANGVIEEGTLKEYDGAVCDISMSGEDNSNLYITTMVGEKCIVAGNVFSRIPLNNFGDVTPDKVMLGERFTSTAGVLVEGTMPVLESPVYQAQYDANKTEENSGGYVFCVGAQRGYLADSVVYADVDKSDFGDAQPSDVRKGKSFTSADGVKIEGTYEPASIATCTVEVTFSTNVGNCQISATTFNGTNFSVFTSNAKSGTVTIPNVVCDSAISINTALACSLYWSGSIEAHKGLMGGTITVPETSGTYSVEVDVYDE